MPRSARLSAGGVVYHALNRANAGTRLFLDDRDYQAFERVLAEAQARVSMRILSYALMPNHWHFVLWPLRDGDLSEFLRWLTQTHTQRWHAYCGSVGGGHLYQGRFKSFPVEADEHFLTLCRYVERNPLTAGLVSRAEDWYWSSLWRRVHGRARKDELLARWPVPYPLGWVDWVNRPQSQRELDAVRGCIKRGCPFGSDGWARRCAHHLSEKRNGVRPHLI